MKIFKKLTALWLAILIAGMPMFSAFVFAEESSEEVNETDQYIEDSLLEGTSTEELLGDTQEEEATSSEDGSQTGEQPEGEKVKEEEPKNISELIASPKLSGVDFVDVYEESFEALRKNLLSLGIFTEAETDPTQVLTRAEFSVLVAKILNNGEPLSASADRYEFKDVDEYASYAPAINLLCNLAIIQGDGNGMFYPENEIKSAEAIILLLNTLGYYEVARARGEGDIGYKRLANDMKFIKDAAFSYEKTVDLYTAAKLIYRALHERVVEDYYYSGGNVVFSQSPRTLMNRYMDIFTIEGIVSKNEYTSIYGANETTSKNHIEINNTILKFSDETKEPYNYLGLYARAYFRNSTGANEAVFIEAVKNRYDILKINAKDIDRYEPSVRQIYYYEGKTLKTEDVLLDLRIIFNNELVEGNIDSRYFTPDAGQLVFIDNNRDGKYDILIIDSYSTYVVKSAITDANLNLYDELNMQNGLNFEQKDVKVYKNNAPVKITDLSVGDVAFVATERVAYEQAGTLTYQKLDTVNSKKVKILASSYALTGNLESFADEYLYIEGVEYEYSKSFLAASEKGETTKATNSRVIGVSVTGAYDLNGDIVWMLRAADESIKYAFLIRVAEGSNGLGPNVMKFFSQDGKMEIAEFAKKVKVFNQWDTGELNRNTYYAISRDATDIVTIPQLISGGKTKRQLIRYKLNDEGKITQLYLSAPDNRDYKTDIPMLEEGIFYHSQTIAGDTNYFSFSSGATGVLSSFFIYRKSVTYGFKVPADETIEEEKYFRAFTPYNDEGAPFVHNSKPNNLELYNIDGGIIGAFLHYDTAVAPAETNTGKTVSPSTTGPSLVIENVRMVKNEETEEFVPVIDAWKENKLTTYTFATHDIVSNDYFTNKAKTEREAHLGLIPPSELKKGDIITAHLNKFGEIDGFAIAHRPKYDFDNLTPGNLPTPYERGYNANQGRYYESGENHMYISGYHRGKVIKIVNGAPIVETQQIERDANGNLLKDQNGDYIVYPVLRRLILNSTQNQLLIYDYKSDTLTLTQGTRKCADFSQLEVGDYLYWHQKVFNTQTSVAVRNYE